MRYNKIHNTFNARPTVDCFVVAQSHKTTQTLTFPCRGFCFLSISNLFFSVLVAWNQKNCTFESMQVNNTHTIFNARPTVDCFVDLHNHKTTQTLAFPCRGFCVFIISIFKHIFWTCISFPLLNRSTLTPAGGINNTSIPIRTVNNERWGWYLKRNHGYLFKRKW